MPDGVPTAELEPQFSSDGASPTPWADVQDRLETSQVYWLSTVRPDGRPHVTPLVALWLDGAMYFSTGPTERKARNLVTNIHCVITTGCNALEGLDVVVEGDAERVRDEGTLRRVAEGFTAKYEPPFQFTFADFTSSRDGRETLLYRVAQTKVLAFGKGESFSQTRWRF